MSRLKLSVNLPKGLDPAAAERYAQAAVDELAQAYTATKPQPRPRGGLRTSFSAGADPVVLVFPRGDIATQFDQLLDRGAWADPSIGYLVAALGAAVYGLSDPAAVLTLCAAHGVAIRVCSLWNRLEGRPFELGLRISSGALQVAFDPRRPGAESEDEPALPRSCVVSAQMVGTRALAAVSQDPEGWIDVAGELFAIVRRKYGFEPEKVTTAEWVAAGREALAARWPDVEWTIDGLYVRSSLGWACFLEETEEWMASRFTDATHSSGGSGPTAESAFAEAFAGQTPDETVPGAHDVAWTGDYRGPDEAIREVGFCATCNAEVYEGQDDDHPMR